MRIKDVQKYVLEILEKYPSARSNDLLLYGLFCKEHFNTTDVIQVSNITTSNVFESISRSRRKIQERNPNLLPEDKVKNNRKRKEKEFKEYGRG